MRQPHPLLLFSFHCSPFSLITWMLTQELHCNYALKINSLNSIPILSAAFENVYSLLSSSKLFSSRCSEKLLHSSSFDGSCFLLDSSCPRTVLGPQRSVLSHLLLSPLSLSQKSCPASQHQLSCCEETSISPGLQFPGFSRQLDISFHLAFSDTDKWNH